MVGNGKFSFPSRPLVPHKEFISLGVKVRETTVHDTCYRQEGGLYPGVWGPLQQGLSQGRDAGLSLNTTRKSGNLVRGAG